MRLDEANQLLEPGYLPAEAGFTRLDDGQLHVAALTTMVGFASLALTPIPPVQVFGIFVAFGIMLALYHRHRTGKGQMVDASLYGAQLFLAAPSLQGYLATGSERFSGQQARKAARNPLWNIYPTKDKWVFICMANDDQSWKKLCQGLDNPALSADPRFDTAVTALELALAGDGDGARATLRAPGVPELDRLAAQL